MPVSARTKRIVFGRGRKAARARKLYGQIASGAGQQQRIQHIFERGFFSPDFKSAQLVSEAGKFRGSIRQAAELREYAKRLARKRDRTLERFKAWGLEAGNMGKPMARTPNGTSAKQALYSLTGWHAVKGPVAMIPTIDAVAFVVIPKEYNQIAGKEFPWGTRPPVFFLPGNGAIDAIISPNAENLEKHFIHERRHAIISETPLMKEFYRSKKRKFGREKFRQGFGPKNIRLGARLQGRNLLDELISNMIENDIEHFERKYKTYYLAGSVREDLGKKTASAFMHNKGGYKSRLLKAAGESAKAVRAALAAKVTTPGGRRQRAISRQDLAALLANIRDIEKVPRRLPVLVRMRSRQRPRN